MSARLRVVIADDQRPARFFLAALLHSFGDVVLVGVRFTRLSRGTLVKVDAIVKVNVLPGGTHIAMLTNGQEFVVSRLRSRILRERLLRL